MRIVADTNVIVSAFLWGGTPRRLLDAVKVPILANITDFGATPLSAVAELTSADAAMVPYPPPALRAMNAAALKVFQALRRNSRQARAARPRRAPTKTSRIRSVSRCERP